MALPYGTTGSLYPSFLTARLVGLTVKRPYAIALYARLPTVLRTPLKASVTLLEATTPVKLPTMHCLSHELGEIVVSVKMPITRSGTKRPREPSLHHSCRSELTRQGISLP